MAATQLREREIREFISELALLDGCGDGVDDAARVQLISVLESLKAAAAAAQARVSMSFDQSNARHSAASESHARRSAPGSPSRWPWLGESLRHSGAGISAWRERW